MFLIFCSNRQPDKLHKSTTTREWLVQRFVGSRWIADALCRPKRAWCRAFFWSRCGVASTLLASASYPPQESTARHTWDEARWGSRFFPFPLCGPAGPWFELPVRGRGGSSAHVARAAGAAPTQPSLAAFQTLFSSFAVEGAPHAHYARLRWLAVLHARCRARPCARGAAAWVGLGVGAIFFCLCFGSSTRALAATRRRVGVAQTQCVGGVCSVCCGSACAFAALFSCAFRLRPLGCR